MGSLPMIIPPLNVSSSPRNYLLSRHTQVEMSLLDCSPPTHTPSSFHYLPIGPPVWDLGPMYLLPEAGCWRAQSCTDKHNCGGQEFSCVIVLQRWPSPHFALPLLHLALIAPPFLPAVFLESSRGCWCHLWLSPLFLVPWPPMSLCNYHCPS